MGTLTSGRGGIPPRTVATIARLLDEGVAVREISRRTGCHREKIRRVRHGEPLGNTKAQRGTFVRCPGCGGRVIMPCWTCRVRTFKAATDFFRMTVCDECKKTTDDLYFIDPVTNRSTDKGLCRDCYEPPAARAMRPALPPARDERPFGRADFTIPLRTHIPRKC